MLINGRRLNCIKSNPDPRDYRYKPVMRMSPLIKLPQSVDLHRLLPSAEDQGDEGSCSAFAAAGAVQFLELKEMHMSGPPGPQVYNPKYFNKVSKHFIYWNERVLEGTTDSDAGVTTLRDACDSLVSLGVCRESVWPYTPATLFTPPSDVAIREAARHRLACYYALGTLLEMRHCLAIGYPFILGFSVPSSFMSVGADGEWQPSDTEYIVGGHAVLAIGYDDAKRAFRVRNSWGKNWGLNGDFFFPYGAISTMANDFFTLRFAQTNNP